MTDPWTALDCARILRAPDAAADKYSRGVVGLRTGSPTYPGAAVLSTEGAWRTGAGLVRWVGDPDVARLVLQRRPETVIRDGRVGAWVVGSGTDADERTAEEYQALERLWQGDTPVVVDAGALESVAAHSAPLVLTPHAGEFSRLQQKWNLVPSGDAVADVLAAARALDAVVLLKGHRTLIADPDGHVVRVDAETSWTSTAGSGDVLAGAIGAVIAQRPDVALWEATATAAWVHARAARLASHASAEAGSDAGRPFVALDLAEALPLAVHEVLGARGVVGA